MLHFFQKRKGMDDLVDEPDLVSKDPSVYLLSVLFFFLILFFNNKFLLIFFNFILQYLINFKFNFYKVIMIYKVIIILNNHSKIKLVLNFTNIYF